MGLAHDIHDDDSHQTFAPEALQQLCSTQHKYWMELQRLQQLIQRTVDQIRDPGRQLPSRTPTSLLT